MHGTHGFMHCMTVAGRRTPWRVLGRYNFPRFAAIWALHTYIHTYMHPHILTYAFSLRLLILLSMTPRWHRVSWQLVVRGHRAFDSTDFIQRSGTRGARKPWSPE